MSHCESRVCSVYRRGNRPRPLPSHATMFASPFLPIAGVVTQSRTDMFRRSPSNAAVALLLVPATVQAAHAQERIDSGFQARIAQPEYPFGEGPLVLVDRAHNNFHADAAPFEQLARLLGNDGYRVRGLASSFSSSALDGGDDAAPPREWMAARRSAGTWARAHCRLRRSRDVRRAAGGRQRSEGWHEQPARVSEPEAPAQYAVLAIARTGVRVGRPPVLKCRGVERTTTG